MGTSSAAAPPLIAIAVIWSIGLGIYLERRRRGGTDDLLVQVDDQAVTIDMLVDENERLRVELGQRRQASMARHPSTVGDARDNRPLALVRTGA